MFWSACLGVFSYVERGDFNFCNMRRCFYFIFVLVILLLTNCTERQTNRPVIFGELHTTDLEKAEPYVWRELLKDYFLCVCITEGFKDKQIGKDDISQAVYFDILRYSPEAFQEVKDYAKKFVETIEPSPIEDLGNKKAIILSCIKKYRSKELDKFIKSMDKYMLSN